MASSEQSMDCNPSITEIYKISKRRRCILVLDKQAKVQEESNSKICYRFVPVLRCYFYVALQTSFTFSKSAIKIVE